MVEFVAWHGKTLSEHESLRNQWSGQGYAFVSLSIYGAVTAPVFAAVMIKPTAPAGQRDWPTLTAAEYQQTFDQQAAEGYGPVIIAATGSGADPLFAGVWEPQDPIPLTRFGLTSGAITDEATIQGLNYTQRQAGQILRWAASYGSHTDPYFAAIWGPNSGNAAWNNDGLVDDPNTYQGRFDAETSAWCRPAFVTLDADNYYMSLFVADEIGPWQARHNMTSSDYQTQFDTLTAQGYFPICVQAAGSDAASAHIAAIFVESQDTVPKKFTATGPVTNSEIDAVVEQTMAAYPATKHAALAIVHGTQLVYARGYTLAQPDWPVVEPTTYFRLASVSKTVTALAIYQLIEEGELGLCTTLQSILNLTTPGGGPPPDPRFNEVTIQQLLEHTSGLDTDSFDNGFEVVAAYEKAGKAAGVPVTEQMTDAYIASLMLVHDPGTVQNYSNCGYYLLGRVVAQLEGTSTPIDAYLAHLLAPLGVTRIRSSVDLVSGQLSNEARYQAALNPPGTTSDLTVDQSQQTPAQPLVPSGYGDDALAIAQGSGGLSAAVTDVARLVSIMIDDNDNPAVKRITILRLLTAASATFAAQQALGNKDARAGYGLDGARYQGAGSYYGQKGGQVQNAGSVFQFNGDWGFVAVFGSITPSPSSSPWYADWPAVMNIATTTDWGDADLFPTYGMPSL